MGNARLSLLIALCLLGGCATTAPPPVVPGTGDATWHAVVPPGTARYKLAMGEVASGSSLRGHPAPVYPAQFLSACPPPVEVTALLVVDTHGKVGEVRVDGEPGADARRRSFIDAVRAAALQWQFDPLEVDHWTADANGDSQVIDRELRPFSLAYVFRFECTAGHAQVSTRRDGS